MWCHPSQIKTWKHRALDAITEAFSKKDKNQSKMESTLYEEIGRLKIENEFKKKKISGFSMTERLGVIVRSQEGLSLREQCSLLDLNRSSFYYVPHKDLGTETALMHRIDEIYTARPFYGYRRIHHQLQRDGIHVNHKRVLRLMNLMGIQAIHPGPRTSKPHPDHKIYPYLLRNMPITSPNLVWAADVTYIRLLKGFVYLVAIMDWFSRYIISWQLSPNLEADFCVTVLEEALWKMAPSIFNTAQGSQFTCESFTGLLLNEGVQISMDGRGSNMDNIVIERLWRTIKYEEVYLKEYSSLDHAEESLSEHLMFYNQESLIKL